MEDAGPVSVIPVGFPCLERGHLYKKRYSGYAWTDKLKDTSTATVTAKLNSWFVEYGYPEYIRTDFKAYYDKHYIYHKLSSLYNPESNDLAEAAVKNMKSLILCCADRKEELSTAIACLLYTSPSPRDRQKSRMPSSA